MWAEKTTLALLQDFADAANRKATATMLFSLLTEVSRCGLLYGRASLTLVFNFVFGIAAAARTVMLAPR